jgi:hypothetical protein
MGTKVVVAGNAPSIWVVVVGTHRVGISVVVGSLRSVVIVGT